MLRTLNFRPGRHAFFELNCLGEGCAGGGLDISGVPAAMVRNHEETGEGNLHCTNSDSGTVHASPPAVTAG